MLLTNNHRLSELSIFLLFCYNSITSILILLIRIILPVTYKIDTIVIHSILISILAFYVIRNKERINYTVIGLIFIIIFINILIRYILNYELISTDTLYSYIIKFLSVFIIIIPFNILIITQNFYKILERISIFLITIGIINLFSFNYEIVFYSQSKAYEILPAFIISAILFKNNYNKIFNFIILISSFTLLFIFGARGPIITCIIFYILISWYSTKSALKKCLTIISFFCLLLLWLNLSSIFKTTLEFFNISNTNRIAGLIVNNEFFIDTARNDLIYSSLDLYLKNPIFGIGPLKDLYHFKAILLTDENILGFYSHNIFLDFLLHYGVFGILFIFYLLYSFLKKIKTNHRDITLMIFGISIIPLLFSATYIHNSLFFAFLGILFNRNET